MTRRQVPPGTRNVGAGSRRNDYIRPPVRVVGAKPPRKGCALVLLGWAAAPVAATVARVRGWV